MELQIHHYNNYKLCSSAITYYDQKSITEITVIMSLRKAISLNAVSNDVNRIRQAAHKQRKKRKASDSLKFELVRPKASRPSTAAAPVVASAVSHLFEHDDERMDELTLLQQHQLDEEEEEGIGETERRESVHLPVIHEETMKESSQSLPILGKSEPLVPRTITATTTMTTSSGTQPSEDEVQSNDHDDDDDDDDSNIPHLPENLCGDFKHPVDQLSHIRPLDFILSCFTRYGIPIESCDSLSKKNYFIPITDENLSVYQTDAIKAIRHKDVESLRQIKRTGRSLQGINRFGESFMHVACRRGSLEILDFLMNDGKCSLRVHDDFGRTPLHGM